MPGDEEIQQLRQCVLDSAFTGQALPGSSARVTLPDLHYVLRQPAILLLNDGKAQTISQADLPKPLRVMSPPELEAEARGQEVGYLMLRDEVLDEDTVRVTLSAQLMTSRGERAGLGLSAVHVTFRKRSGAWLAEDGPVTLAA